MICMWRAGMIPASMRGWRIRRISINFNYLLGRSSKKLRKGEKTGGFLNRSDIEYNQVCSEGGMPREISHGRENIFGFL